MKTAILFLGNEITTTEESVSYHSSNAEKWKKVATEALEAMMNAQTRVVELKKALAVLKYAETSQGGEELS